MEMGERVIEGGHWNPGISSSSGAPQQQSGQEGWTMPVDCLMNGMLPQSDSHMSMFNNSLVLPQQFRHRLPHPGLHFSNSTQINHHMHDNGINLNIPQHPMVENAEASSLPEQAIVVQETHSQPMSLISSRHHVLDDCSEECTEDDDDDEVTDDDMDNGYVHPHDQQMNSMGHSHSSICDGDSLPACRQQHPPQLSVISVNGNANMIRGLEEASCHQKSAMMSTGLGHVHDNDIPAISEGHPLNSNPISAIPMITGNPMLMSDESEDVRDRPPVESERNIHSNNAMNSDLSGSNIGHSVHGKMYVEDRVVFHLKQWTDTGFGNFSSCREDAQKNQMYRCAVCHLRSSNNGFQQKDTHRHPVRGVLLSYEDCIIVELYPEHFIHPDPGPSVNHIDPKQSLHMESSKSDHSLPPPVSYINHAMSAQNIDESHMNNIIINPDPEESEVPIGKSSSAQDSSWWEEFDPSRQEHERMSNPTLSQHSMSLQSHSQCVVDKLNAQHFHDNQSNDIGENTSPDDHQQEQNQTIDVMESVQNQYEIKKQSPLESSLMESYLQSQSNHDLQRIESDNVDDSHEDHDDDECIVEEVEANSMDDDDADGKILSSSNAPSPAIAFSHKKNKLSVTSESVSNKNANEEDIEMDTETSISNSQTTNRDFIRNENSLINNNKVSLKLSSKVSKKHLKLKSGGNKYPCPSCAKSFNLKRILKQHLEEKHSDSNPFRCTKCKLQFTDQKRFQRHSCTLSVDAIKSMIHKNKFHYQQRDNKETSSMEVTTPTTSTTVTTKGFETTIDKSKHSDNGLTSSSSVMQLKLIRINSDSKKSNEDKISLASDSELSTDEIVTELEEVQGRSKKGTRKQHINKDKVSSSTATSTTTCTNEETGQSDKPQDKKTKISKSDQENLGQDDEGGEDDDYESQTRYLGTANKQCLSNHKNAVSEGPSGKKKLFSCDQCDKTFSAERRLASHIASHHRPEKSSQCDICGKSFARKDKLLRHMFVHSEEKLFACDICEKRFSRKDKLTDHLKSHQTEQVHDCSMCEKQFLRPDILKQHVKLHQMNNKHQCPECLRFVTGKDRLVQHMKRHEEAKALGETLLCPLCTKYFIQRQSLKAHIRKFHPDALQQIRQLESESPDSNDDVIVSSVRCDDKNISDSPPSTKDRELISLQEFRNTEKHPAKLSTVCLVIGDVMGNNKPSTTPGEIKQPTISCKICHQTFSRKQSLQKHLNIKHSAETSSKSMETNIIAADITPNKGTTSRKEGIPKTKSKKSKHSIKFVNTNTNSAKAYYRSSSSPSISTSSSISSSSTSPPASLGTTNSSRLSLSSTPVSISIVPQQSRNLQNHLVPLPSCSSLTHSLSFESVHHQQHPNNSSTSAVAIHSQQAHLNVYSHHLALAAAASISSRSIPSNNCSNAAPGSIMSSITHSSNGLEHGSGNGHQQLSYIPLNQINMGVGGGSSYSQNSILCPSSPYIINYQNPYEHQ